MPGLVATATLDARQMQTEFASIVAQVTTGNAEMAGSAKLFAAGQVHALEQQLIAGKAVERELAAALAMYVSSGGRAITVTEKIGKAAKDTAEEGANMNTVFGRLITIMKDLVRGQWTRAISSFTSLLQELKISVASLFAGLSVIAIAGYVMYRIDKAAREAADGFVYLVDKIGQAKAALREELSAMNELAKAEMEYAKWKNKQADELNAARNIKSSPEERIRLMREEFEWQQRIANLKKQTPQQAVAAEISEREKEQAFLDKAVFSAQSELNDADRKKYLAEQGRGQNVEALKKELAKNKDVLEKSTAVLPEVQDAFNEAKQNYDQKLKTYHALLSAGDPRVVNIRPEEVNASTTQLSIASDKNRTFTLQAAQAAFDAAKQNVSRLEGLISGAEGHLSEVTSTADDKARALAKLEEQRNKAAADLALLKQYGPQAADDKADELGKQTGRIAHESLTANQRAGAFIAPGTVSLIGATMGVYREVKGLRQDVNRHHAENGGSF